MTVEKKYTAWGLGILVLVLIFLLGMYTGRHSSNLTMPNHPSTDNTLVTDAEFEPFWKAWKILNEKYVAASTTKTQDQVWGLLVHSRSVIVHRPIIQTETPGRAKMCLQSREYCTIYATGHPEPGEG